MSGHSGLISYVRQCAVHSLWHRFLHFANTRNVIKHHPMNQRLKLELHGIAKEVRACNRRCFVRRYQNIEYDGLSYTADDLSSIRPLVSGYQEPRILLISEAPSLQAWIHSIDNPDPDGGLIGKGNSFFVKEVLPTFGLGEGDIEYFRHKVFWIHSCNCYPWFRKYRHRQNRKPTEGEIKRCLGRWNPRLISIDSIRGIVLMGEVSTRLFPKLNPSGMKFTELVARMQIRTDIQPGKEIIPIYHQSRKNRIFNELRHRETNKKLRQLLKEKFVEWTS